MIADLRTRPEGLMDPRSSSVLNMASNFRHLAGCKDGTGTFCC